MSVLDPAPPAAATAIGRQIWRAPLSVLLIILGLGCCVLWKIASGTEQHSWDSGAVPPAFVQLTGGHSYAVSIHGGVPTELKYLSSTDELSCTVSASGIGTRRLTLTAEQEGTNATDQIASFVSPVTGDVRVACSRLPDVFVDDADDAGFDYAGLLIWLGAAALVVGLPLGLSVLRESYRPRESDGPGDHDQIQ